MRAHLVQMEIAWEDKAANHRRVERLLDGVGVQRDDLVLLPEMFDTGFSLNTERTADGDGATLSFLRSLASSLGATVIGGRTVLPEGRTHAHNLAVCVGPDGEVLCEYAKIHPFSFGREPERFVGGERVEVFDLPGTGVASDNGRADGDSDAGGPIRMCPAVCYDLRFPELFRLGLLRGAEVYAIGANWPSARQRHWRALAVARAIENEAIVLGVNRCGSDPHLSYLGGTIAVGPQGEVLGELREEEAVLTVGLDVARVRKWRETFPAWRDVRLIGEG